MVILADEDVRGFQVAVNDALLVGVVQRFGDLLHVGRRAVWRERILPRNEPGQVGARDIVH